MRGARALALPLPLPLPLPLTLTLTLSKVRVALELLQKIVGNILSEPAQPKYRTLKVDD